MYLCFDLAVICNGKYYKLQPNYMPHNLESLQSSPSTVRAPITQITQFCAIPDKK